VRQTFAACLESPAITCANNEYCSLTVRKSTGGVSKTVEMNCKEKVACLSNKRNNGWMSRGECQFGKMSEAPSVCRQCCEGACEVRYARFATADYFAERNYPKWRWNEPGMEWPISG